MVQKDFQRLTTDNGQQHYTQTPNTTIYDQPTASKYLIKKMKRSNITTSLASSLLTFLLLLLPLLKSVSAVTDERPNFQIFQSRAKHHFTRAGEKVEGEEELRKVILGWYAIPGAEEYQICHQCVGRIDESTGRINEPEDGVAQAGRIQTVSIHFQCGGHPCLVLPAAPLGFNHFHLRYKKGGEWSLWSTVRNYNVGEIGPMEHQEL
mmetsp:Transcript_13327/g.20208  ORF Transcript_13327/g.20208 Transcript_13327/m.20208 type:complete len:207 (-) Transcript_13327:223-843(-)|eukprot:CAMPEP_0203676222 /NCGR_PEP_ID=MMETSP0090-20130426/23905_1 /ASSEMBLY_ACC=CAM_ASM_001088 /TAXON_ID=426623 /ORGANISM="Chaetoceros affinis, Strain CCMP159" /LENGTH=206 /DNA_ID=CAMNT_0050542705 /DNA_START=109 /DNA_END=729 /DNA_ORIENTATION=-